MTFQFDLPYWSHPRRCQCLRIRKRSSSGHFGSVPILAYIWFGHAWVCFETQMQNSSHLQTALSRVTTRQLPLVSRIRGCTLHCTVTSVSLDFRVVKLRSSHTARETGRVKLATRPVWAAGSGSPRTFRWHCRIRWHFFTLASIAVGLDRNFAWNFPTSYSKWLKINVTIVD